ncbi:hypothetical protein NKH43_04710 [Mesorhizobium sp. M1163]
MALDEDARNVVVSQKGGRRQTVQAAPDDENRGVGHLGSPLIALITKHFD